METYKILILSVIQGFTELLPVSSSGHLILFGELLGENVNTLLLTTLHLGTTLAIILYSRDILFRKFFSKEKLSLYLKILVSSIPAGIVGVLFTQRIEESLRATWIISISLIVWGIVMILVERIKTRDIVIVDMQKVTWKQSIVMGFAQCIALIPGTSRSGITTIAGILTGLEKFTSLQYSFILGLPILLGASALEIYKELNTVESFSFWEMSPYILIAFIFGYISILLVQKFNKKNWLTFFGIYRILLGILILIL